jgi:acetyltransferase-like isoleucine patch superfamily enzyme
MDLFKDDRRGSILHRPQGDSMINGFFKWILNMLAFLMPGGYTLRPFLQRLHGVKLGRHVWISQYVYFDGIHPEAITIGDNVAIGLRTTIFAHFYSGPKRGSEHSKPVIIEEDAFIGPHCVIMPGVRIGKGAVVQAGTVVSRKVPPGILWGASASGPLAIVTRPCPQNSSWEDFIKGLRPYRRKKMGSTPDSEG